MTDLLHYRLRVITVDSRQLIGELLAFDKHMNLVLSDTEEFRITKKSKSEEKRTLGLIILRGETVVSVSIEAPPTNSDASGRLGALKPGPGLARGISRSSAPPTGLSSLAGPIRTNIPAGLPAGFGPPPGFQPPPGFGGR